MIHKFPKKLNKSLFELEQCFFSSLCVVVYTSNVEIDIIISTRLRIYIYMMLVNQKKKRVFISVQLNEFPIFQEHLKKPFRNFLCFFSLITIAVVGFIRSNCTLECLYNYEQILSYNSRNVNSSIILL